MGFDLKKLENVRESGGKVTARCPACVQDGGDAKGEHLVVYRDGKYGCVAHPKDKEHARAIFRLVGIRADKPVVPCLNIRRVIIPDSTAIMEIGRLGRPGPGKRSPGKSEIKEVVGTACDEFVSNPANTGPARPAAPASSRPIAPCEIKDLISTREEIDKFLGRTA
ncbi:MAG: hypothetical protein ACFUZC_21315 [Chthoniobacteraceae bacterium]